MLILEITVDEDSKVIITMLDHLQELGEVMGGGIEYTHLFPLLEEVMQNEEEKIRDKVSNLLESRSSRCMRILFQSAGCRNAKIKS